MEMTNDFKEVRSKFMLQKAGMIHGLTEVSTSPKVFSFAGSPEILNVQMHSIKNKAGLDYELILKVDKNVSKKLVESMKE